MNAITVYLVCAWFPFRDIANRIAGGPIKGAALGAWAEVLITALVLVLVMLLARFLYRRKIFLRL